MATVEQLQSLLHTNAELMMKLQQQQQEQQQQLSQLVGQLLNKMDEKQMGKQIWLDERRFRELGNFNGIEPNFPSSSRRS